MKRPLWRCLALCVTSCLLPAALASAQTAANPAQAQENAQILFNRLSNQTTGNPEQAPGAQNVGDVLNLYEFVSNDGQNPSPAPAPNPGQHQLLGRTWQNFNMPLQNLNRWHGGSGYGYAWFESPSSFSGMTLAPVDASLRAHLKLPKDQGLIVTEANPGSPAGQAGIWQNDILLKLGDTPVTKIKDLEDGLKAAGDKPVTLSVLRTGSIKEIPVRPVVTVTLGPLPVELPGFRIGVSTAVIESVLRVQLMLPPKGGLIVLDVVKDGPAAKAGVRPHDILLLLNGEVLSDEQRLIAVIQATGGKTVPLELIREGKKQTIMITPQGRKNVGLSSAPQPTEVFRYNVVGPGVVLPGKIGAALGLTVDGTTPLGGAISNLNATLAPAGGRAESLTKPQDERAATTKQLDDIAAQVKELRQAVEALSKAIGEKK